MSKASYPKPLRPGPSESCVSITDIYPGVRLYYHCYVRNGVAAWTHLRISGTQVGGWMRNTDLDDLGSTVPC